MRCMTACVWVIWMVLSSHARAQSGGAVDPLVAIEALPASSAGVEWLSALGAVGARVPAPFPEQVAALHPLQAGTWEAPFYAVVAGVGGAISLQGTVSFTAVGPAETHVRLEPEGKGGVPESWAWRRLFKKVRSEARGRLSHHVTTPAAVYAEVAAGLADPLKCAWHMVHLESAERSEAVSLVVETRNEVATTCEPAALGMVARQSDDPEIWQTWYRQAWVDGTAVERASLLKVLLTLPELPDDLAFLVADTRAREASDARRADLDRQRQAAAPVQCADGSIDAVCRCGDARHACCVHHGGFGQCLPPPPVR